MTESGSSAGKRRLILLLLALGVSATLIWLNAAPLAVWAAGQYLESRGLELARLEGPGFDLDGVSVAALTLANGQMRLEAAGVRAELAPFRIERMEVASLRLEIPSQPAGAAGPLPELAAVLQALHEAPFAELAVDRLELALGAAKFRSRLRVNRLDSASPGDADSAWTPHSSRPALAASLEIDSPWPLSLRAESPDPESIRASLSGPDELRASLEGAVTGREIEGAMEISLNLDTSMEWFESSAGLPTGTVVLSGPYTAVVADSDFTFTSPSLTLAAPELTINLPLAATRNTGRNTGDTHVLRASLQISQTVLRYWRAGAVEAGRWYALGHFESQMLELPWLAQTRLYGSMQLSGSGLRANASLSAGDRASLSAELLHPFAAGAGFADIEIPRFQFDAEYPLSELLPGKLPDFDILAGAIAGTGNVEWDGGGLRGGMQLRLEDLSGHFGETAFLDFDTDMEIELTPDLSLRSARPLAASLRQLDPGLPLDRLRWNYSFDSGGQTLEIRQMQADFLDGQIALPALRLARGEPLPNPNLVLSDIDLAAATRPLDYDALEVSGRVSGYLPLRLESGLVRIEDGLIGALQPGGRIRYTPEREASDPRMRTVNELLSDYRFDSLNSHVQLDEAGDLLPAGRNHRNQPGDQSRTNPSIST